MPLLLLWACRTVWYRGFLFYLQMGRHHGGCGTSILSRGLLVGGGRYVVHLFRHDLLDMHNRYYNLKCYYCYHFYYLIFYIYPRQPVTLLN